MANVIFPINHAYNRKNQPNIKRLSLILVRLSILNLTLKRKLLLSISLALLSVIVLLSSFSYLALREQVIDGNYQQIERLTEKSAQSIASWLEGKCAAIRSLQQSDAYRQSKSLLLIRNASDFISVYFGDTQGDMTDDDPTDDGDDYKNYDPRQQSWYQEAQSSSKPVLTKPYLDTTYTPAQVVFSVV